MLSIFIVCLYIFEIFNRKIDWTHKINDYGLNKQDENVAPKLIHVSLR